MLAIYMRSRRKLTDSDQNSLVKLPMYGSKNNDMNIRSIEVIVNDLENNPHCFHGPSLLFKKITGKRKAYYACSACRDRKDCNFFIPYEEKDFKIHSSNKWKEKQREVINLVNKMKVYKKFLKMLNVVKANSDLLLDNKRKLKKSEKTQLQNNTNLHVNYCYNCNSLFESTESRSHNKCKILSNLTYHQLKHPTDILIPKTNTKTHAQYFFSETSVKDIVLLLIRLKFTKILCIGVPKIHEYVLNECSNSITSVLLDLDVNYYNFYSKKQFIWYNMFNNYVFDPEQKETLYEFLETGKVIILMDPPFGGRVEPLAKTLFELSKTFSKVNNKKSSSMLETFWFFPYFMEQHIMESLPNFRMFDYKVNYENHASFTDVGNRKRKFGSPVRIFTNIPLPRLDLKDVSGYKFCESCGYWVSNENKHCVECNACTSKNGRTYVHCLKCSKCVKPSYNHCETCLRCCLPNHVCGEFQPNPKCYHCHQTGHKKNECPMLKERKKHIMEASYVPKKKRKVR